jgi:hypothetical protein
MNAKDQLKVIQAGFTILRFDDYPNIRIKIRNVEHKDWATLEVFKTKAARDRYMADLLVDPFVVED